MLKLFHYKHDSRTQKSIFSIITFTFMSNGLKCASLLPFITASTRKQMTSETNPYID